MLLGGTLASARGARSSQRLVDAARVGDDDKVRELLDAGVDVDARDPRSGKTALLYAAYYGHLAVVRALLAGGADVNAATAKDVPAGEVARFAVKRGRTALWYATLRGKHDVMEALIGSGARADLADVDGVTPLAKARARHDARAIEILGG